MMFRKLMALLIVLLACGCQRGRWQFPDTTPPLSAARLDNRIDEYGVMVSSFGEPDVLWSAEKENSPPRVPTRIALYRAARIKVIFAPNGCVELFQQSMRIAADATRYPDVAEDEARRLPRCAVPTDVGWTIVGYVDPTDQLPLRNASVNLRFASEFRKRSELPEIGGPDRAVSPAKPSPRETKHEREMARFKEEAARVQKEYEDQDNLRRGCQVVYLRTADKKLANLTVTEAQQIGLCQTLGLYH
jgi:hypothetical protein